MRAARTAPTAPTTSAELDEIGQYYAAHRLELVRLAAFLLPGGDARAADAVVQEAFLVFLRRGGRGRDPGAGLSALRRLVVRSCRIRARRGATDPAEPANPANPADVVGPVGPVDPLAALTTSQREAVVLAVWVGLADRPAAAVLGTSRTGFRSALRQGLDRLGTDEERLAEALHERAGAVTAINLRGSWADVVAADARQTARTRRGWRAVGAVVLAGAAVVAAAALVGSRAGDTAVVPAPTTEATSSPATDTLSSPALAPGEQPRSAIPWGDVAAGWAVIAAAAPPTAVTTTLLLVSPTGTRYALGTAPDSIVVQDISPDGRRVLVAVGSQASEWDLVAGTSRPLGVSFGWKTMRYAGAVDRGYLVIWTDSGSSVQMDHWSTEGRLLAEYPVTLPPTAGSPGTPGVVVDASGRQAVVGTRDGPVRSIDLASDAVGSLSLPEGASGCSPRGFWSAGQVVLACTSGGGQLLLAPLDGSPSRSLGGSGLADGWPVSAEAALVQRDDPCSTTLGTLNDGRALTPRTLPAITAGLVPNTVVGHTLFLGGTRCATDGSRLVAYDLGSGEATLLAGEDAGGRTVRQAVVLPPPA